MVNVEELDPDPFIELLGKIGIMMASPLVKLLRTLQAPLVNVGLLMGQLKDKKSKETPA